MRRPDDQTLTPTLCLRGRGGRNAGLTLLELLIVLVMIAAILPVAMRGITLAMGIGSLSRERGQAAMLAQGKLDELVASGAWQTGSPAGDFGEDWPGYTWTAQSQDWDGSSVRELDVTVQYTWRDTPRTITMSTLVSTGGTE